MINQEKVRLMTKIAIFEKKEKRKVLKTSSYRRKDYISFYLIVLWLTSFIAGMLIIGLLISYQAVSGTSLTVFQYSKLNLWISFVLAFFVMISLIYLNIGYQWSTKKYDKGAVKFEEYKKMVEKLELFYEENDKKQGGGLS